jgi:hypothetical protein
MSEEGMMGMGGCGSKVSVRVTRGRGHSGGADIPVELEKEDTGSGLGGAVENSVVLSCVHCEYRWEGWECEEMSHLALRFK